MQGRFLEIPVFLKDYFIMPHPVYNYVYPFVTTSQSFEVWVEWDIVDRCSRCFILRWSSSIVVQHESRSSCFTSCEFVTLSLAYLASFSLLSASLHAGSSGKTRYNNCNATITISGWNYTIQLHSSINTICHDRSVELWRSIRLRSHKTTRTWKLCVNTLKLLENASRHKTTTETWYG